MKRILSVKTIEDNIPSIYIYSSTGRNVKPAFNITLDHFGFRVDFNKENICEGERIFYQIYKTTYSMTWQRKNHGSENPHQHRQGQRALFVGRWQPYHNGHIELINQKLQLGIPVLIFVRDIEPDERNPFTTEQTIQMIKKYHQRHNHDVIVQSIPDIESINFGRDVGYEVNEFIPPHNINSISASKIRESIKNNDNEWKLMIDNSLHDNILKYLSL